MRRNRTPLLFVAIVLAGLWAWSQGGWRQASDAQAPDATPSTPADRPDRTDSGQAAPDYPAMLPREAHPVLDAIARAGPYEYRQDGGVFQNREHALPLRPRGYYREFTVETPGSRDRGARRIVTGGDPPAEYFYTDDHYRSFRRFQWSAGPHASR